VEVTTMSLSARDQQALDAIEDALTSSDPGLTAMLTQFSRLAAGEDMPVRERIRIRDRRRRGARARDRSRWHPGWACKSVALWLAISVALVVTALAIRHNSGSRSCATWTIGCDTQPSPRVTEPASPADARNLPAATAGRRGRRRRRPPESAHGL
jgi:hypothetical protein